MVGQLDLNVSEHVGNGHFEFLGAGGLWKGRRWPCQPQAMLNQSDGSSRQTEVRRYVVSLASTSGGTRHEGGLCSWTPLTGIKTWSVVPSPLLAQHNPLPVFQQRASELLPLIISHRMSVAGGDVSDSSQPARHQS